MKLKQLSLFIENKSGALKAPCKILADHNINISTLSLADTQQFGILRLIIKEWEKAKEILEQNNFVVKITEVLSIKIDDTPGGLYNLLNVMDELAINVEYMYAFTDRDKHQAIMVFRFENTDEAISKLESKNIDVISSKVLFNR